MRLGQAARFLGGTGFPHAEQGGTEGVPFLKVSDLEMTTDTRVITSAANYVTRAQLDRLGAKVAPPGTVVMPKIGAAIAGRHRRVMLGVSAAFDNNVLGVVPVRCEPRFLAYVLRLLDLAPITHPGAVASLDVRALGALPLPDLGVGYQGRIADFLDRECERMSRLSDHLAKMSRVADIACRDRIRAQLADAGPVVRLRRVIRSIGDGPFGSALASKHYVDRPGVRVIRLGNVGEAEFLAEDVAYISTEYFVDVLRAFLVSAGDVVVAGLGDAGHPLARACVVPNDLGTAIHKADCYRVRVDRRVVLPEYLALSLSFGPSRDEAALLSRGTTRARLNTAVARDLPVVLPSLSQQIAILGSTHAAREETRGLRAKSSVLDSRLTEYRDALIAEAVTGQLDVTTLSDAQLDESARAALEGEAPEVLAS